MTRRRLLWLVLLCVCVTVSQQRLRAATLTVCASGCTYTNSQLQTALNAAVGGDVILLQEGYLYQGTFTLPYHATPTSYVEVRTGVSATGATLTVPGNFPAAGVKVGSSQATTGNFAKFQSITSNQAAIRTPYNLNPPSQYWRLKWIEVIENKGSATHSGPLIQLGSTTNADQPTSAHVPHHFDLTQIYVHGSATRGQFRCITIHADNTTVQDSTIEHCYTPTGLEGQAIWLNGYNSTVLLEDNTISGGSEVVYQGGAAGAMRPTATVLASGRTTTTATLSTFAELHVGQGLAFDVNGAEQYTEIVSCGTAVADAECTSADVVFAPALSAPPDTPGDASWGSRPSGLTIRRNIITRPLGGKSVWVSTVTGVTATAVENGGTLAAGTYCASVVARRGGYGAYFRSTASAAQCATITETDGNGSIEVAWTAGTDIDHYYVYMGPTGLQNRRFTVTSPTTSFTDTGATGTTETVPTSEGTKHAVKNTVEIKNGRNVLIEGNIIENSWPQAQTGFLMVLTPANTGNGNDSTIVKDVEVRYNIFRSAAGGIQTTVRDAYSKSATDPLDVYHPSGRFTGLNVHNNLFYDMGSHWGISIQWMIVSAGGTGSTAMYNTGARGPLNWTINHNTILQTTGQSLLNLNLTDNLTPTHDAENFDFTNNIGMGFSSQLTGVSCTPASDCWTKHTASGSDWQNNFISDVTCANYPGGCTETLTNTAATLMGYFVNPAAGNYRLTGSTPLDNAATDATDIGADIVTLESVMGGAAAPPTAAAPVITTTTMPNATIGAAYCVPIAVDGGTTPLTYSVTVGSLTNGLTLNASTGQVCATTTGVVTGSAGTINFTVQVADSEGTPRTDTQALSIVVVAAPAALTISTTSPLPAGDAVVPLPYCFTLTATGGTAPYTWDVTNQTQLPPGIPIRSDGRLGCDGAVPTAGGTYNFTLQVTDANGTSTTKAMQLVVTAAVVAGCTRSNSVTVGGIPLSAGSFVQATAPSTCVRAGDTWRNTSVSPPETYIATGNSPSPGWTLQTSSSANQPLLAGANDTVIPETLSAGSILVRSAAGLWETLPPGSVGDVLTVTDTGPSWQTVTASGGSSAWTPMSVTVLAAPMTVTVTGWTSGTNKELTNASGTGSSGRFRVSVDTQGYSQVAFTYSHSTTATGFNIYCEYWTGSAWAAVGLTSAMGTSTDTHINVPYVTLPAGAQAENRVFRFMVGPGDGSSSITMSHVRLHFRP
jgi:hypothetical protein